MTAKKAAKKAVADTEDSAEVPDQPPQIKTGWIVVAVVLVGLAIFLLVRLSGQVDSYSVNGFEFVETQCTGQRTCWQTNVVSNVGVHPIAFYYGPRQVEDVLVDPAAVERVLNLTRTPNASLFIAFDEDVPGEVGIAAVQLARVTGDRLYRIPTRGAVYGDVTCADATPRRTIVYLREGDLPAAVLNDDCVILSAPNAEELLRVEEAFSLHLLQIIQ